MERDSSLHGALNQPFSLYKSHSIMRNPYMEESFISTPNYNTFSLSSNSQSKGLLRAPPLSLIHSAPPPQPPLLPLPAALPRRSFSCPPHPAIKIGARKPRNHFSSHKKSTKSSTSTNNNIPTKEEKIKPPELPKNIARVAHFDKEGDMFTIISPPPPSSLPLPTFSLRLKLACNAAVAAGVDDGATDDLRRILRLQ